MSFSGSTPDSRFTTNRAICEPDIRSRVTPSGRHSAAPVKCRTAATRSSTTTPRPIDGLPRNSRPTLTLQGITTSAWRSQRRLTRVARTADTRTPSMRPRTASRTTRRSRCGRTRISRRTTCSTARPALDWSPHLCLRWRRDARRYECRPGMLRPRRELRQPRAR